MDKNVGDHKGNHENKKDTSLGGLCPFQCRAAFFQTHMLFFMAFC